MSKGYLWVRQQEESAVLWNCPESNHECWSIWPSDLELSSLRFSLITVALINCSSSELMSLTEVRPGQTLVSLSAEEEQTEIQDMNHLQPASRPPWHPPLLSFFISPFLLQPSCPSWTLSFLPASSCPSWTLLSFLNHPFLPEPSWSGSEVRPDLWLKLKLNLARTVFN